MRRRGRRCIRFDAPLDSATRRRQTAATSSAKWQATGWPWPRSTSAGSSSAQMSCAFQHRVRNRQPDGGFDRAGHVALEHDAASLALLPGRARAPPTAAPGCTGAPAARRSRRAVADLDDLAEVHHRDSSEMWRTTDRSWAMNRYARPSSVLQVLEQVHHAGLDRHVERRHRLVEHEQRPARARARGRCRCAGAGRRRTRAGYRLACSGLSPTSAISSVTRSRPVAAVDAVDPQRLRDDRADASSAG